MATQPVAFRAPGKDAVEAPTRRTRRRRRSHTQLADYLHCAHAFKLKRINKISERPSVWLAGGKAFHSFSEDFDKATWQEDDLSQWADYGQWENAFALYHEQFLDETASENPDIPRDKWRTAGRKTKDKPNGETIEFWQELGKDLVKKYIDWRVQTNSALRIAVVDGGPAIELETQVALGGVPMVSYADRVFEDPKTGALLIGDLKTGTRTPASLMQLATYAHQLEQRFDRPIEWGAFYDARKGTLGDKQSLENYTRERVGRAYRDLDRAVNLGIFLPTIDTHCRSCGLRPYCVWQGGVEPDQAA